MMLYFRSTDRIGLNYRTIILGQEIYWIEYNINLFYIMDRNFRIGDCIQYNSTSGNHYKGKIMEYTKSPYSITIQVYEVTKNTYKGVRPFHIGDKIGILPKFMKYTKIIEPCTNTLSDTPTITGNTSNSIHSYESYSDPKLFTKKLSYNSLNSMW